MTTPSVDAAVLIRRITNITNADVEGLAHVLVDCVAGGASVSFMSPLTTEKASAFWRRAADRVARGDSALLVGEDAGGIVGTVQLILDQPENQPHRADLSKMLVHRRARRRGVGAALLREAEKLARELGRSILVLETASAEAARLYTKLGWVRVGIIPHYALLPGGGYWRHDVLLSPAARRSVSRAPSGGEVLADMHRWQASVMPLVHRAVNRFQVPGVTLGIENRRVPRGKLTSQFP